MHILKLLSALFKINIQMALAYRVDTVVNILINLLCLGWELLSLSIIFSNTTTLGGLGPGRADRPAGRLPPGQHADADPDLAEHRKIQHQRARRLAGLHLAPAGEQHVPGHLLAHDHLAGLGPGPRRGADRHRHPHERGQHLAREPGQLCPAGCHRASLILYSLWIVLIAATFWFIKFDNNVTILQALLDTGRYPATIYPLWLRLIVTFLVPVAVATTVPAAGAARRADRRAGGAFPGDRRSQLSDRLADLEGRGKEIQRRQQLIHLLS